jgi:hypothetical protein
MCSSSLHWANGLSTEPRGVDQRGVRAGIPGPRADQGRADAGSQQQRGPAFDGLDVGSLEDEPLLQGDLLADAALADANGPDGHVVVADQSSDVAGEPGRVDASAMSFLVALPYRAARPASPQTVTPYS